MLSERHRASDRDRAWSRVRLVVVGVAATLLGVILLAARPVPANAGTGPRCSGLPATIVGTPGDDTLVGTAERDVIVGLGGDDVIRGGASADVICAGRGRDILFGGASTNHRRSTAHGISRPAADFIDIVDGGRGDDVIRGGRGDDWLFTGRGDDLVLGGHGDEIIGVSRGHDTYVGGRGRDSLAFSSHLRCCSITVNLTTGRVFGAGFVARVRSIAEVWGGRAADTLIGNAAANTLRGGSGDDTIRGRAGNDNLDGGAGTDGLNGGPGIDMCTAGETTTNCE